MAAADIRRTPDDKASDGRPPVTALTFSGVRLL
jgi:hypothetical protein